VGCGIERRTAGPPLVFWFPWLVYFEIRPVFRLRAILPLSLLGPFPFSNRVAEKRRIKLSEHFLPLSNFSLQGTRRRRDGSHDLTLATPQSSPVSPPFFCFTTPSKERPALPLSEFDRYPKRPVLSPFPLSFRTYFRIPCTVWLRGRIFSSRPGPIIPAMLVSCHRDFSVLFHLFLLLPLNLHNFRIAQVQNNRCVLPPLLFGSTVLQRGSPKIGTLPTKLCLARVS